MPIFEYRCPKCGATFEQFTQRAAGAPAPACPKCGARPTERLLSAFSSRGGAGCGSAPAGGG